MAQKVDGTPTKKPKLPIKHKDMPGMRKDGGGMNGEVKQGITDSIGGGVTFPMPKIKGINT